VHKEFIPEGKTVKAEFYKGVMDHLKGIQQVCPDGFFSRDGNRPASFQSVVPILISGITGYGVSKKGIQLPTFEEYC
jgi:hypothetical protein